MGEHYVRLINIRSQRFDDPLISNVSAGFHGVVNEFGFRLFAAATLERVKVAELQQGQVDAELHAAIDFIERFRKRGRATISEPDAAGRQEATELAQRLQCFVRKTALGSIAVRPTFAGCGWINHCEGDVLDSETLYEVKAADRSFRMLDIRQTLIYCALNFASKAYVIDRVCLCNPRLGTFFCASLETICQALAGRSAVLVMGDLIEYISEGVGEYRSI